jgi:hypothetical protein
MKEVNDYRAKHSSSTSFFVASGGRNLEYCANKVEADREIERMAIHYFSGSPVVSSLCKITHNGIF